MNNMNSDSTPKELVENGAIKNRSITPAASSMAKSHGMKFSLNMTSQDKKELLKNLEEWRKARGEKLAASILAKQKQVEKPKSEKIKQDKYLKSEGKESVFERLYKDSKKTKKQEDTFYCSGSSQKKLVSHKTLPLKADKLSKTNYKSQNGVDASENIEFSNDKESCYLVKNMTIIQNITQDQMETKGGVQVKDNGEAQINEMSDKKLLLYVKEGCTDNKKTENDYKESQLVTLSDKLVAKNILKEANEDKNVPANNCTITKNDVTRTNSTKAETYTLCGDLDDANGILISGDSFPRTDCNFSQENKIDNHFPVNRDKNSTKYFKVSVSNKHRNPLRRSISMMFHQKCRSEKPLKRAVSAKNLHEVKHNIQNGDCKRLQNLSLAGKSEELKKKIECTANSRLTVTSKNCKSLTSTPLRTKLENWLKVNGHSLEKYRHLRCFGIASNTKPLLKGPSIQSVNSSQTSLQCTGSNTTLDDSDKENNIPQTVIEQVQAEDVQNWLKELHRLIVELKYPSERCEEWLAAIRKKCTDCTQMPIYWECLAALHESKGDIKSAIDNYERAIIKGGEVDAVGDSLAKLFDKMVIEKRKYSKSKLEKGLDPKNIFKSTVIKFALQQKALKELGSEAGHGAPQQQLIATPVRRSSRIQTPFKSDVVTSLQSLTPDVRRVMKFKPNKSLLSEE